MENSDHNVLPAGDPLPGPEFDGNGYDTNDEVLLLQMMEMSNEAVSPNLQAVLDDRIDFGWPSGRRKESPLVMERPRSSGADIPAFSFAKPVQDGKPFSLQPSLRRPSSGTNKEKPDQDRHAVANLDEGQNSQAKTAVPSLTRSVKFPTSSHSVERSSLTTEEREGQSERGLLSTMSNTDARPESRNAVDYQVRQVLQPKPIPACNQQQLSLKHGIQEVNTLDTFAPSPISRDRLPDQPSESDKRPDRVPSFERLDMGQSGLPELRSNNNQWKVVKRRHSDKRRTKRVSYASSDPNLQVPEEVLFQQLISRLRAREESEVVASNLQKEMEASMIALREENNVLKEELEIMGSKLEKRTTEARTYKSQTDSWKSKLAKVKIFLNELGAGYQNLRGEAIHFKATRKTLDKERKELTENIEDVKARLGQISQNSHERRSCLSEAKSHIASLEQERKHERKRAQYAQDQFADEKKRSRLLELYIQTCSRAQDRKLDLVKTNQLETMKTIKASYLVISDNLERKLDDLFAQVGTATESLSNNKMDVHQCRETICTFESRMDTTTRQLGEDIRNHSRIAEGVVKSLEEQVQIFKGSVSDGSSLLKQLSASEDRCIHLQTKLEGTAPTFEKLGSCLDGLWGKLVDLGQRMEGLETRLSEVKLPERLEDGNIHISEKLGFQNEIQQLALKLKLTEEKLEAQQHDSAKKDDELSELTARAHEAEKNAAKLELQTTNLQEKIEVTQREVQDSIDRAIASSRDKCGAGFERRLHELLMEKTEIEADTKRAKEQLAESQRRLVEGEESARKQRNDLDLLFMERHKRIEVLEASRAEQTSSITRHEAEIEKMREKEAALTAQQTSLRSQLDEARERSKGFECELLKTMKDNQLSRNSLQDSFSTLQGKLARKEEDCQALQDRLSSIQNQLVKKEEECQTFQDSLYATQGELTESKKERQALQGSLSSLQNKVVEAKAAYQVLQDILSSIKNRLARKEEEYGELSKELEVANSARMSLESGRSKANAEIHALLKRVQDSASGMKNVREILHRVNIAELEQPLPEALNQLEKILQAANSSHLAKVGRHLAQVRTPETSARDESRRVKHGAHSLETQTNTSADEPKTPVNHSSDLSPSKQARNIVPFSSILQGMSPAHCSISDYGPLDLSCVLTQTPERISTPQEPGAISRPEEDNPLTGLAPRRTVPEIEGPPGLERVASTQGANSMCTQEQTHPSVHTEQGLFQPKDSVTARKVSFVTRKLTVETNHLQVPDSQEKGTQNNLLESSLNGDNPTRTNRWTYSKRQRETSTRQQEPIASERVSSQAEYQQTLSKKAKTSSASSALVAQSRTASEQYDRQKVPTRLASGSSRTSSNVPIADQSGTTKNRKRSGRRTRGDKYNARFSQGAYNAQLEDTNDSPQI